ncbi:MAG TPA: polymer-forming cytoskeletal protein [Thermomicrobiales bacterium]|jgi:cytoskeletal protein CcmA (bactofilin family)|nr:polymer-forming cytoskeletal protein [Thermomicrobiales bacterium]
MSMRMPASNEPGYRAPTPEGDSDTFSVIDRNSIFDGTFQTTRDLQVEGEVKGTIDCKGTLFVAGGAVVGAKVEAENVTVAGDLNGEVRCRGRLQIMPTGRVRGKIVTQTLVINEGAFYEGQLEMAPPESRTPAQPARPVQQQEQKPPVAISTAASRAAATEQQSGSTFIRRLGGPETPWERQDEDETERASEESQ